VPLNVTALLVVAFEVEEFEIAKLELLPNKVFI
jgi:hypothetical protein